MSLGDVHLGQRHATLLQKDLTATNLRYRLLIDGVQDYALYTIDGARRIVGWNGGAEKMFGYTEAEILGRESSCLYISEDTRKEVIRPSFQEVDQQGWIESEGWRVRKDGTRFFATGGWRMRTLKVCMQRKLSPAEFHYSWSKKCSISSDSPMSLRCIAPPNELLTSSAIDLVWRTYKSILPSSCTRGSKFRSFM
jgi:PAS domain S-box-containing protein